MLLVVFTLLNPISKPVQSLVMALSGCVGYEVAMYRVTFYYVVFGDDRW
jgi:hypothetical protein